MGVYIPNMEMPKDGETVTITICADGITFEEYKELGNVFRAVPVPPHGRCIDADAFIKQLNDGLPDSIQNLITYRISKMPTIIEAEEGE